MTAQPVRCTLCGCTLTEHTVVSHGPPPAGLVEAVFPDQHWRGVYCRPSDRRQGGGA